MNDLTILDNIFENNNDMIHFQLFKESNTISINNDNNGDYSKDIIFNTRSLACRLINYQDAYILLGIQVEIPYDDTDQGKKSVPKLIALKKSYELVEYLRIMLNNVIITNESSVNRSSLINYILNNSYNDSTSYRNISKADSSELNISDNEFIKEDTYFTPQEGEDTNNKYHYIDFEVPIFLKDISDFFKNITVLQFAEFNINLRFIDNMIISSREGIITKIKSCHLYLQEIKLQEEDYIKYLKMLNNGYTKSINFSESNTKIFNDKMSEINENFYINNIRNADAIYLYGILDANKEGLHYDMPSIRFIKPQMHIDSIKFENQIPNDISAYTNFKNKSINQNNFLISYENFKQYYRIYTFNVSRQIRNDHNIKFFNITTDIADTSCTAYAIVKSYSSIKLEYSKTNGLIVYKTM